MRALELVAADGVRLDAVVHPPSDQVERGTVIQAHGITVDMDEGGMFVRLAQQLAGEGFTVVRFLRGHGRSEGTQSGVTIAGEMLDLQAAVDLARSHPGPLSVVAASFAAIPVSLSLPFLDDRLRGLVFWNPLLDPHHTFVEPELPWGLENFAPDKQQRLHEHGFLLVDDEFELGRVMFEELRTYRPADYFMASQVPAVVVHGDRDTYVSYDVAKTACTSHARCELHTVVGSDHEFDSRDREDEAIAVTVDWLTRPHTGP